MSFKFIAGILVSIPTLFLLSDDYISKTVGVLWWLLLGSFLGDLNAENKKLKKEVSKYERD